eukprot:SAG31_NODE_39670_length_286_cov_1.106952_1_plen_25_part_10
MKFSVLKILTHQSRDLEFRVQFIRI